MKRAYGGPSLSNLSPYSSSRIRLKGNLKILSLICRPFVASLRSLSGYFLAFLSLRWELSQITEVPYTDVERAFDCPREGSGEEEPMSGELSLCLV